MVGKAWTCITAARSAAAQRRTSSTSATAHNKSTLGSVVAGKEDAGAVVELRGAPYAA